MNKVYCRKGKKCGIVIGKRACTLEGCTGVRLCVKWKDGQKTYPCTKGMKVRKDGHLQII